MALQPLRVQLVACGRQLRIDLRRLRRTGTQVTPGILRDHGEGQCLGQAQLAGRLVEIGQAGGAHALHVASVGSKVEIRLQDLPLGIEQLQLHRPRHLAQLAQRRAGVEFPQQPRQLHGDGGAALRMAVAHIRHPRPTHQAVGVETRMPTKPAVLVQQHAIHQLR